MKNKKIAIIILAVLLTAVTIGIGFYSIKHRQEIKKRAAPTTKIYFAPALISSKPEESFSLDIMVNTGGNSLAALSLEINYGQDILEAKEFTLNTSLLPTILKSPDLSQPGKILADAGIGAGSSGISGVQKIGTVIFKIKQNTTGETRISFNQNTTKASAATALDQGVNLINNYDNALVTIEALATPTPIPTQEPTSIPTAAPTSAPPQEPTSVPTATPTPTIFQVGIGKTPTNTPYPTVTQRQTTENLPATSGGSALTIGLILFGLTALIFPFFLVF